MLDAINNFVANAMDYVLGWVLYLPRDLGLFAVALLTSALMTFVRPWSTDQEWLGRADADKKRLGELMAQARRDRDKPARKRFKDTLNLIKLKSVRFEGKPLLWVILPVALLATWCFCRLGFEAPKTGQEILVRLYTPASATGDYPHLLLGPDSGLSADSAVQEIVNDQPMQYEGPWDKVVNEFIGGYLRWLPWYQSPPLGGVATWKLQAAHEGEKLHVLKFVYGGKVYEKELLVGSRYYSTGFQLYEDEAVQCVEIVMKPTKLFGVIGGVDWLFIPPWLVAYLLIAIPLFSLLKRIFRIY